MNTGQLCYLPDEWAHDLDQWWAPLADLASQADCTSVAWLNVLGVNEFFDDRLLDQPYVLTPWLCVASAAVAASAARAWAESAARADQKAEAARALAATAFDLAVALEKHRWSDRRLGEQVTSTTELIEIGRAALGSRGHRAAADPAPVALHLLAGWLARSGGEVPLPGPDGSSAATEPGGGFSAQQAVAAIAGPALGAGTLICGTAHLVERLATGMLDPRPTSQRPDDPPAWAWATVLLVADTGKTGRFAVRRQHSMLPVPSGTPVPDLARLAFIHAGEDFLGSVADAFAAAQKAARPSHHGESARLDHHGEIVSWSLHPQPGHHPLAERSVSGRSAGLGAYVAFRSLSQLGLFAGKEVAFTGQVFPDGRLGPVGGATDKIGAAGRHGVGLVIHPRGQKWQDHTGTVELREFERAEDVVLEVAAQLRGLRCYLEAACQLVAPEPWLRTWLAKHGHASDDIPLLTVMCRHLPPARHGGPGNGPSAGEQAPGAEDSERQEPEIPPCPAHLLASCHRDYSFAVSADAGGGNTMAAKRMVAEAARQALECLRTLGGDDLGSGFILPLYAPLSELPTSWDELVRVSVEALPALAEFSFEVAAALVNALRTNNSRRWRALVVVDGTDRAPRDGSDSGRNREREFITLVTSPAGASGADGAGRASWRPSQPAQLVLCGRNGSPSHLRATEALRHERYGAMATMGLEPLAGPEIDHFVASLLGESVTLTGAARDLAANPLLLMLSVIAADRGGASIAEASPVDLFDRGIGILLGPAGEDRRFLAEIAFRAATAKNAPAGAFTMGDLADSDVKHTVETALAKKDHERVWAMALGQEERDAFGRAAKDSHLLIASGSGWRFFHDRAFAFLVADRIARHAVEDDATDDELFGVLGPHLGDPLWADVIEAIGRLLELHSPEPDGPEPGGPGPDDPGLDDPGLDGPGLDGPRPDGPGLDGPERHSPVPADRP